MSIYIYTHVSILDWLFPSGCSLQNIDQCGTLTPLWHLCRVEVEFLVLLAGVLLPAAFKVLWQDHILQ